MYRLIPLLFLLLSVPAAAWQVAFDPDDSRIHVTNDRTLSGVETYLVEADLDQPSARWHSWSLDDGWRPGLQPAAARPLTLAPFADRAVADLPEACDEERRCILALVAVAPGDAPLDSGNWLAASIHPLTAAAARLRLPGQRLFLSSDGSGREITNDAPTALAGDTAAPTPTADGSVTESTTEKPDLFRLEGSRLLYANGSAERFQVIDLSDPAAPRLAAQLTLQGTPREIYALDGYYLLMQGNQWGSDEGTRITTLRLTDDGILENVAEYTLDNHFVESRRRDGVIYAVTQQYGNGDGTTAVTVHALAMGSDGSIEERTSARFDGYSPTVAIFPDHLVVTGHDTSDWRATNVQLYDLDRTDTPLHARPQIQVPGQIPSEFHLDVSDGLLRLVYGPPERDSGSTLAIYDLGEETPTLAGSVGAIAPGEALFATRFVGDTAYVVTYERTDPLWVIDLTDPTAPALAGELEVPGWSEQLFFHDQRLFAVGIDDQPSGDESWARRVAVSLFDVADPTRPQLLSRLTPQIGAATYTHSPALDDERALLLDWTDGYAALPITGWDSTTVNQLQLVSIGPDTLIDGGQLATASAIQRSVELDGETLAALGDQTLVTLLRGNGTPQPLGELELARNLTWIAADGGQVWVSGNGDGGYRRLYRHTPDQLEEPAEQWTLADTFVAATANGSDLLFYNVNPLTAQRVHDGQPGPLLTLEEGEESGNSWWQRSLLLTDDHLYLSEHRATIRPLVAVTIDQLLPEVENEGLSTLRSWQLAADGSAVEESERTIPGQAVAVSDDGELLTLEYNYDGSGAQLHRLTLEAEAARLVESFPLPCSWPTARWQPPALYVTCAGSYYYAYDAVDLSGNATTLIRYGADGGFHEEGRWELDGATYLMAANASRVLVNQYRYGPYTPVPDVATLEVGVTTTTSLFAPPVETSCRILDLSGSEVVEVATVEDCSASASVLTDDRLLQARGYAGIRETRW
ncbi:beta-propeller domain-containing protein [Endothiovibrio diazotrophicus]